MSATINAQPVLIVLKVRRLRFNPWLLFHSAFSPLGPLSSWQAKRPEVERVDLNTIRRYRLSMLVFFPESAGEEHEDGHNLKTSHEHEEAEEPLDVLGQYGP